METRDAIKGFDFASSGLWGGKSGYLHQDLRERVFFSCTGTWTIGGGGGALRPRLRLPRPLELSSTELVVVEEEEVEVLLKTSSRETNMEVSGIQKEETVAKH